MCNFLQGVPNTVELSIGFAMAITNCDFIKNITVFDIFLFFVLFENCLFFIPFRQMKTFVNAFFLKRASNTSFKITD